MDIYICEECRHIEFEEVPDECPVCFAAKTKFIQMNNIFIESEKRNKGHLIKHIPLMKIVKKAPPVPEKKYTSILVRIGKQLHPAEEEHFIKFIDCYVDQKYVSRIMLTPYLKPSAVFHLEGKGSKVIIIEECNIHGHWMREVKI